MITTCYCPQTKFAKVMFSQVSVCPQGGACMGGCVTGEGVCMAEGDMHGRGCAWWGSMCGRGECMAGEHTWWGCAWQGACVAGEMATAACGTHPTGMHSC